MYHSSSIELSHLSNPAFWRFFNTFDTVLTNCEGVLWNFDQEIKGSAAALNRLRECGKQIFFISNNSIRSRNETVNRAREMGFIINKNEVISSSYLTAYYLKSKGFKDTAYILGSRAISEEFKEAGIKFLGVGRDFVKGSIEEAYNEAYIDPNVKAVIVGVDEYFSLTKILKAATYLKNPDCEFFTSSLECRMSGYRPKVVPASGAILKAVETCSGRKALNLGKPSVFVKEFLIRHHCLDPERTLHMGDRLKTDMLFSSLCGFQSLIVLTGMTSSEEMTMKQRSKLVKENYEYDIQDIILPNFWTKSLSDILNFLK